MALRPADFHTTSTLAAPARRARHLDYTFPFPKRGLGAAIMMQAATIYISAAKGLTSTRPGPFLEVVLFFGRGLMMLIAAASSFVFKCAA